MKRFGRTLACLLSAGVIYSAGYFSALKNNPKTIVQQETYFEGLLLADSSMIDFDKDGDVDIILSSIRYNPPTLYAVAPDMIGPVAKFYELEEGVADRLPRMTGEIQDLATSIFRNQKKLGLEIAQHKRSLVAKK